MKKRILLMVFAAVFFLLTSCGQSEEGKVPLRDEGEKPSGTTERMTTEQNTTVSTQDEAESEWIVDPSMVGRYLCTGRYLQEENLGGDGSWYELRADGTGTGFDIFQWEFVWKTNGTTLWMTSDTGMEIKGAIEGDVLTVVDELTSTVNFYTRKELEPASTESIEPTESTAPIQLVPLETIPQNTENSLPSVNGEYGTGNSLRGYWERGWYGWWCVEQGFGAYADWGNGSYWWDCCADIIWEGDGILQLTLWDEDGSRREPMAEVALRLDFFKGHYGTAYSESGQFWETALEQDAWCINPDEAAYEELLILEGVYYAPDGKGDGFRYTVYLRPWGTLWDDWYADEADCLPDSYESWYLPMLKQGVKTPPDQIG